MIRVTLYEWPESQECMTCQFAEGLSKEDLTIVCHLNHDKTKEDNCSSFSLLKGVQP